MNADAIVDRLLLQTRDASAAPPRRRRMAEGALIVGAIAVLAIAAPWLAPDNPFAVSDAALRPPSAAHPFGTDDLGRDIFSGVVYGARVSLLVGILAASIASAIGFLVGGVAGLRGGGVDDLLMRGVEFFQALPRLFLVIVVVTFFGHHFALIAMLIAISYWPATARLVRGQVLVLRTAEFVLAARLAGAGSLRVLTRHLLPAVLPTMAAQAALQAGGAVLVESGLSFLGLGDPAVVSWGAMLSEAHHFMRDAWWMATFPGLAITLTVIGWSLLAEASSGQAGSVR